MTTECLCYTMCQLTRYAKHLPNSVISRLLSPFSCAFCVQTCQASSLHFLLALNLIYSPASTFSLLFPPPSLLPPSLPYLPHFSYLLSPLPFVLSQSYHIVGYFKSLLQQSRVSNGSQKLRVSSNIGRGRIAVLPIRDKWAKFTYQLILASENKWFFFHITIT